MEVRWLDSMCLYSDFALIVQGETARAEAKNSIFLGSQGKKQSCSFQKIKSLSTNPNGKVLFSSVLLRPVCLIYGNSSCFSKNELSSLAVLCCYVELSRSNMFTLPNLRNFPSFSNMISFFFSFILFF